jgi:hypothetical protein
VRFVNYIFCMATGGHSYSKFERRKKPTCMICASPRKRKLIKERAGEQNVHQDELQGKVLS